MIFSPAAQDATKENREISFGNNGYDIFLMSDLTNNDPDQALPNKIYLATDGTYIVRDSNGITVHSDSLPEDAGINLNGLEYRLNDPDLKNAVLAILLERGHANHNKPQNDYFNIEALQSNRTVYDQVLASDEVYLSKKDIGFAHSIVFMDTPNGERHPFILGKKLGESNNVVRRAIDVITGEKTAVKILKEEASESPIKKECAAREEQREMNALIQFNRYRGNATRQKSETVTKKYFGQELVTGSNYAEFIAEKVTEASATKDADRLKEIFTSVYQAANHFCNTVHTCHENGYLHRDIKPANMMIDKTNQGYVSNLVDFGGMVRFADLSQDIDTRCGTQGYQAPEILLEKPKKAGRLTDSYATGQSLKDLLGVLELGTFQRLRLVRGAYKEAFVKLKEIAEKLTKEKPADRMTLKDALVEFETLSKLYPAELPGLKVDIDMDVEAAEDIDLNSQVSKLSMK